MRDRNGFCVRPWGRDRGHSGQGRRAHRRQLFQQQDGSRSDRRSLPQGRRRSRRGAGRRLARRGLQEDRAPRPRRGAVSMCWSTMPAPPSTCRTTISTGLSAEDFQRIYAVNTIGPFQMIRAARALLEAGAKASGRPSAVVNVSSVAGIQRRRLVGRLCREQGRAQHHDAIAGARAGAADPRQHRVPRLYRYALVHQGPRRGRRQGRCAMPWWRRCR